MNGFESAFHFDSLVWGLDHRDLLIPCWDVSRCGDDFYLFKTQSD